jgi:hypothetical protein
MGGSPQVLLRNQQSRLRAALRRVRAKKVKWRETLNHRSENGAVGFGANFCNHGAIRGASSPSMLAR